MKIEEKYFEYGDEEINHLCKVDEQLAYAISKIGKIYRAIEPEIFASLVRSIVGQQISTKAQKTIWNRMLEGIGGITPDSIDKIKIDELQKFGISFRKADYIKDLAARVSSGQFKIDELNDLSDEELIAKLTELKGVGVWTAEMLMIFSMMRPNVISYGDLAIRRGMCRLYGYDSLDKETFEKHRKKYAPYASVASLYIWAVSSGALD